MKNTLRSSKKCKETKRRHKTLEINMFAIDIYPNHHSLIREYTAFFVRARSENGIPKTSHVNSVVTKIYSINICEILTIPIVNSAAEGSTRRINNTEAHAKPKRVQTRHKLGHHVIVHHPHNQNMIRRTARMTSDTPDMFGTKSTRKNYLKANKDNRSLPAKTKNWPHY